MSPGTPRDTGGRLDVPLVDVGRARRGLDIGILVYRWASLAWLAVLALTAGQPFRFPELAWVCVGVAGAWTAWVTVPQRRDHAATQWFDLGVSAALVVFSGVVVPTGEVGGPRPFFASAYPVSAALAWGAARGAPGGLAAGAVLGVALLGSRPLNGQGLTNLTAAQWLGIANGAVNYLLAGGAIGVVARVLDRSAEQLRAATEDAMRAREGAARLAERESIARRIHDSVLQALALVHRRGRELAAQPSISPADVLALAEQAADQERELRSLVLREPESAPSGTASLRDALEEVARGVGTLTVTVSATGPLWLPARTTGELAAAVRQALENVAEHAGTSRAAVFAEAERGEVIVSVRDAGEGFVYEPDELRAAGKAGLLKSVKGRVEDLGGTMRVQSAPGSGTEIELRVPNA